MTRSRILRNRILWCSRFALAGLACLALSALVAVGCNKTAAEGTPAGGGRGGRGGRGGGGGGAQPVVTAKVTQKDVPVDIAAVGNVEAYTTISGPLADHRPDPAGVLPRRRRRQEGRQCSSRSTRGRSNRRCSSRRPTRSAIRRCSIRPKRSSIATPPTPSISSSRPSARRSSSRAASSRKTRPSRCARRPTRRRRWSKPTRRRSKAPRRSSRCSSRSPTTPGCSSATPTSGRPSTAAPATTP